MSGYLIAAWVHVVAAVLLVGYALFWVVMAAALGKETGKAESRRLLVVVGDARWPHVLVPAAVRLRLPGVGWVFLAVLVVSGAVVLDLRGLSLVEGFSAPTYFGGVLRIKLALVGALAAGQLWLTFRPSPWLAYLNGGATLGIIVASALLRH